MATSTCGTCKFWQPSTDPDRKRGECRFAPPAVLVINNGSVTEWPRTMPDAGCGDHEPSAEAPGGLFERMKVNPKDFKELDEIPVEVALEASALGGKVADLAVAWRRRGFGTPETGPIEEHPSTAMIGVDLNVLLVALQLFGEGAGRSLLVDDAEGVEIAASIASAAIRDEIGARFYAAAGGGPF